MAVFTVGGREVVASLLKEQTWYLGVGQGDDAWDSALVAPSPTDTDILDKVGATRMRDCEFAVPDADGEITMADGTHFAISATPTRYLYVSFKLDLADAEGSYLRECGIFYGLEVPGGAPSGQFYFDAADVVDWGKLIHLDHFNSIVRDGTIEQTFSFIITL
jgi:hypothetical protein